MDFTYENQGTSTFLVYAIGEEQLDSMSVGMITNNQIPGLVKAVFTQMDTRKYIKYNVSSKIPVKQFFAGPINQKRLLGVFRGIVNAMMAAEEYMIDPNMIIIDTEYMYADVSTCETVLICLPVVREEPQNTDLGAFFKNIMFTAQFDQTEDCDYVAKIMNYLNSMSTFSLEQFKSVLTDICASGKPVKQGKAPVQQPTPVKPEKPRQEVRPVPAPPRPKPAPALAPTPRAESVPSIDVKKASPAPASSVAPEPQPMQGQDTGEKMSLFYLLQHYNKENAAAYKAQKEQKKGKSAGKVAPAPKESTSKKKKMPSFAVPGQPEVLPAPPAPPVPRAQPEPVAVSSGQGGASLPSDVTPEPPVIQEGAHGTGAFGDFGGTVYLSADDQEDSATVILGQGSSAKQIVPHLLRKRNNEKIPLIKPTFRLGRDVEFNDYAIADNIYVGHSHCHIVSRDGEYFVVDDNSKNHTAVDGICVPPGQEVKLTHGCILSVANEEFEFKLY